MDERKSKENTEYFVCEKFLGIYNKKSGSNIKIERRGDPDKNEPDFMCSGNVAIEVTGSYATADDARASNKMHKEQEDILLQEWKHGLMIGPMRITHQHYHRVDEILKKHNKINGGNYSGCEEGARIFLVCNALVGHGAANMFIESTLLEKIKELLERKIVENKDDEKQFDGIFLLHNSPELGQGYDIERLW